jgi:hypothetical protein
MAYNKTIAINILSRIAKNKRILLGIAFALLLTGIALATSTATSPVIIYAFSIPPP